MKRFLNLSAILTLLLFSFTNCSNEDIAEPLELETLLSSKATVEGYVYLNVNKNDTEVIQYAPEGTQLSFAIPYSNFDLTNEGSYVLTTKVGADGHYSIELPVRKDGMPISVNITGEQIYFKVETGNITEEVLFSIQNTRIQLSSELTYQKRLTYTATDVLSQSANWKEGKYKVQLKYYNGMDEVNVPKGTQVKVRFTAESFIPARSNDLIFLQEVGDNGILEVTQQAPALIDNGLPFNLSSTFIAEYITNPLKDEKVSSIFVLSTSARVFGNETIEAGKVLCEKSSNITSPESTWTKGTYQIEMYYFDGAFYEEKSVPAGTKLKVVVQGSQFTPSRSDLIFITNVGENGIVRFNLDAPSPMDGVLLFSIESSTFMVNDYRFSTPYVDGYMFGDDIVIDGGRVACSSGTQIIIY